MVMVLVVLLWRLCWWCYCCGDGVVKSVVVRGMALVVLLGCGGVVNGVVGVVGVVVDFAVVSGVVGVVVVNFAVVGGVVCFVVVNFVVVSLYLIFCCI